MKTKNVVLFLALVLVLFQGCIPSLYPLYTKDKLVTNKEIEGVWVETLGEKKINLSENSNVSGTLTVKNELNTVWDFKAYNDGSFRLIYVDSEGTPGVFDAHLVKLGDDYFFNFSPGDSSKEDEEKYPELKGKKFNDMEIFNYYPANTFAKVSMKENELTIALFDGGFLEDLLDRNLIRIKHEKVDDQYILTAQPEELQKFIIKYADNEDAFGNPLVLSKQ